MSLTPRFFDPQCLLPPSGLELVNEERQQQCQGASFLELDGFNSEPVFLFKSIVPYLKIKKPDVLRFVRTPIYYTMATTVTLEWILDKQEYGEEAQWKTHAVLLNGSESLREENYADMARGLDVHFKCEKIPMWNQLLVTNYLGWSLEEELDEEGAYGIFEVDLKAEEVFDAPMFTAKYDPDLHGPLNKDQFNDFERHLLTAFGYFS